MHLPHALMKSLGVLLLPLCAIALYTGVVTRLYTNFIIPRQMHAHAEAGNVHLVQPFSLSTQPGEPNIQCVRGGETLLAHTLNAKSFKIQITPKL